MKNKIIIMEHEDAVRWKEANVNDSKGSDGNV